jgi:hypothetical protein
MEQREIQRDTPMNTTKTTLIENSLKLLGDNPNYTFYAVTIRPYESFLRKFPYFPLNTRTEITEEIIQNLITKYDAHLISHPNKPQNRHLKIISHNAIETKTKSGSPDLPHSHGIWGIHKTLIEKWNSQPFHDRIMELGSFQYEDQKYPLRKVIHSVWRVPFHSSLIEETYPEGWLSYSYKWSEDRDDKRSWGFIYSPDDNKQTTIKEMWDEPHTTNQHIHKGLRREDPLSTKPLRTILGTLQTGTHQGIHQHKQSPVSTRVSG